MTIKFSKNRLVQKLLKIDRVVSDLKGIIALLGWDQETYMPPKAAANRAKQFSSLSSLIHEKVTLNDNRKLLSEAKSQIKTGAGFSETDVALVRELRKESEKAAKLPRKFIEMASEESSLSLEAWKKARRASDFEIFLPHLRKMVKLGFKEADYLGFRKNPYEALLDHFEPGLKEAEVESIFEPLKKFSLRLLRQIKNSKAALDGSILLRRYETRRQKELCQKVAGLIGLDFEAGRLDRSTHPFSTRIGSSFDTRITTRYQENDLSFSLMSTIHETGHALYEQGISKNLERTSLGDGASMAIHESQSRLWENFVGRTPSFWRFFYPHLTAAFPEILRKNEEGSFVLALNKVEPSLLRTSADELTYNLHVILRFEIEALIFKKEVKIEELPDLWSKKMKTYLGLEPKNDAEGVLQDIHWAFGSFGYFPSYSLGNLYAAQFWAKIKSELPALEKNFEEGNFSPLLSWLRQNVHQFGKALRPSEICLKATGETLNPKYLVAYLEDKYQEIYNLP